jgi:hypothetical protein
MPRTPSVPDEVVIDILTSTESNVAIAQRLGFHRNFASRVRTGRCYTSVAPEIVRRQPKASVAPEIVRRQPRASCGSCVHWSTTRQCCDLGIPESAHEGDRFARICPTFITQPLA